MRTGFFTCLIVLCVFQRGYGGDCGGPQAYSSSCQPHCHRCCLCKHHCWCEPAPQGIVVSSYAAFPVTALPVAAYAAPMQPVAAAPASYTFNIPAAAPVAPQNAPSEAALEALQRYLEDARAKAPASCSCNGNGNGSKSMAPLQAPVPPPSQSVESRVNQLESDIQEMKKNVDKILVHLQTRQ
jgi:hypothetical protein